MVVERNRSLLSDLGKRAGWLLNNAYRVTYFSRSLILLGITEAAGSLGMGAGEV